MILHDITLDIEKTICKNLTRKQNRGAMLRQVMTTGNKRRKVIDKQMSFTVLE